MTDDEIVAARIVEVVNRAIGIDAEALESLFEHRASCNESLLSDDTIKTRDNGRYRTVGVLGLLSGIAGNHQDSWEPRIEAVYEVRCPRHPNVSGIVGTPCCVDGCLYKLLPYDLLRLELTEPPNSSS